MSALALGCLLPSALVPASAAAGLASVVSSTLHHLPTTRFAEQINPLLTPLIPPPLVEAQAHPLLAPLVAPLVEHGPVVCSGLFCGLLAYAAAHAALELAATLVPRLLGDERGQMSQEEFVKGHRLGGGSYGSVYEASRASNPQDVSAVIKTVSGSTSSGQSTAHARRFGLAELYMNRKLALCDGGGGHVAQYLGHYSDGGRGEHLNLVFRYEV